MLICDTGPLVAAALTRDPDHRACVDLLTGALPEAVQQTKFGSSDKLFWLARRRLIVPAPVIAEVGYLLAAQAGAGAEAVFLRSLAFGDFEVEAPSEADFARAADLVERYADLPLATTDAMVVATAERLGCNEVATLDRRDFSVVRPSHVATFTSCPSWGTRTASTHQRRVFAMIAIMGLLDRARRAPSSSGGRPSAPAGMSGAQLFATAERAYMRAEEELDREPQTKAALERAFHTAALALDAEGSRRLQPEQRRRPGCVRSVAQRRRPG